MESDLKGQTIVVTGASGGIGSRTAEELANEGAQLVLHYHRGAARAERLAERLRFDFGVEALPVAADLRDEGAVERMFRLALEQFERLDGLVANAAIWPPDGLPLAQMSLEQWRETVDTNLTGTFLSCRSFLRHLEDQRRAHAAIVLIGSTAGIFGEPGHADYAATKAGLVGLCLTLKTEIVRTTPRGRVNLIEPGWTLTEMTRQSVREPGLVEGVVRTMPVRQIARAADIARAAVMLASPAASRHVSGQALTVAGGMEGRVLWDADEIDGAAVLERLKDD